MRLSFLFAACSKMCLLGLYCICNDCIWSGPDWSDVSKYLYCTAQFNAGNMHGVLGFYRRKIGIIEGNAKCRRLNKLTCKGTLRQVFVCPRPRTPYPDGSTYSHREGGVENSSSSSFIYHMPPDITSWQGLKHIFRVFFTIRKYEKQIKNTMGVEWIGILR
jgi:hypothetical protein